MYDIKMLPKFNIKPGKKNSVKIIDLNNSFLLYKNDEKWMNYTNLDDRNIRDLYAMYDQAYGNVLISGLGFGIILKWIESKPEVKKITVLEISQDVIDLFLESNTVSSKVKIIQSDASIYNTNTEYDCIFLDHYEIQGLDFVLEDMRLFSERIKHKVFWAWPLELIYMFKMYEFSYSGKNHILNDIKKEFKYSEKWADFIKLYFPKNQHLNLISKEKIDEYIDTCFK
jgi:hypothetical protein